MRFTTKKQRQEGKQRTENRGQIHICHPSSVFRLQGFTLVELVVAIGIMGLVILFAGNVFKASIGSYRIASAQAEIMQKFRAITDQLNNDFRGLRKDAPLFIWFQFDPTDINNRLDQIMFFADGDFQSIQTYNTYTGPGIYNGSIIPQPSGSPVVSNLARIYYGQAQSIDPRNNTITYPVALRFIDRVLSRRQHLYIANPDSGLQYWHFPAYNSSDFLFVDPIQNDWFEHDTNSLSQWQVAAQNPTNVDNIITGCFGTAVSYYGNNRPTVNLADANTLHLLMAQKVGNFSVQWSYLFTNAGQTYVYWWPSIDPDGNGNLSDSDFRRMSPVPVPFGFYFNTAAPSFLNWFSYDKAVYLTGAVVEPVYPKALKFTFTLYDSRGVFKDGQTFTHIVYLGD
jgi:prepilin-type N-terminal cleavage/methylation domain-containing protein